MGLSKCHKFSIIIADNDKDDDETLPLLIAVQLGQEQKETYAFIDYRADVNTIFHELFQTLKKVNLIDIDAVFQDYISHTQGHLECVSWN